MKLKFLVGLAMLLPAMVFAQNEVDALQMSRQEVTGSARYIGMGGAFSALGGDISGVHVNPAGIAVYRTSEFSLTTGFHTGITNSQYYGTSTLGVRSNLNIATLGLTGVSELTNRGKWRSTTFGFGMHRTYSFHRNYTIAADQVKNSLLDQYQNVVQDEGITPEQLSGTNPPYPFDIYLAWNNFLLDTANSSYINAAGTLPVNQNYAARESGSKRESYFAFGGNYDDKLYIGGTITIARLRFDRAYTHSENIDPTDSLTLLEEFSFNFEESFSGSGISVAVGAIYRPIDNLRLGLSYRSPTVYSLDLEYESSNTAVYSQFGVYDTPSPSTGLYEFRLVTPALANLGVAYTFGKFGLVSTDIEFVDYTSIQMGGITDGYSFSSEELAIQTNLKPTVNFKVGGEYRLDPFWSLRAGFASFGNPYGKTTVGQGGFNLYSAGLGYRTEEFFVDGAFQLKQSEETKYIMSPELVNPANIASSDYRFSLTFGFKF